MGSRFAFAAAVSLCAAAALASGFELSGTVLDPSGVELAGAQLTLVNEETGLVRTTTSNSSGRYRFPALPPGEYSLEAQLSGFATSRYAGLRYFADTKPIFNVTLNLRSVQESMTFTGEAPLVNVSQSELGLSVEARQLDELPLTRRDYLDLAPIEGSVHELSETTPGASRHGAALLTVNGANAHYTAYRIDGFSNTRDQHGVAHVDVDVSAVEEFRVISGQFSSEHGRSVAGIVSATTRSGSNTFHGSAFAYVSPGGWAARDPLTGADAAIDRREAGLTLSGPVIEDRTHFFVSYAYRDQDDDVVVTAPFGAGRFAGVFELPSKRQRFLFKLSHRIDASHQLTVKTAFAESEGFDNVGGFDIFENRLDTVDEDVAVFGTLFSELGSSANELRIALTRERFRASGHAPPLGSVEIHPTLGNIGNPTRSDRADEGHLQISDTVTLPVGNHRVKAGIDVLRVAATTELERFTDGIFFFPPIGVTGPVLFWQSSNSLDRETQLERDESHIQVFVQDDWQLSPYFAVNLGLRWEKETSVPDNDNFAPRVGFHWDVTGDGRTSVRGGYGIFYNFVFSIVDSLERLYGVRGQRVVAESDPPPGTSSDALASSFYLDAVEWAPGERRAPSAQHVTLGVERELLPTLTAAVDVSYIRGNDLVLPVDVNAPAFFDYTTGDVRPASAADRARPFGVPGGPIPPGGTSELPDGYPFDGFRDLYLLSSRGSSRYWSVKVNLTKRYAADFFIQAVYNWSRTENDGDDFRVGESLALDPARPELEWGRSGSDIPHALAVNGVWDAPVGIRLSGVFRARSGRVVDPRVDADVDGDLKLRERAASPGVVLDRNSFRVGAHATLDLAVAKEWELGEGRRFSAAAEIFNVANRLNPRQYLRSYGADASRPIPSFGEIVHAAPPRRLQLSVRFAF